MAKPMSASQQVVRLPPHAVATRNAAAQAAVLLLVEELYKVMHLPEVSFGKCPVDMLPLHIGTQSKLCPLRSDGTGTFSI